MAAPAVNVAVQAARQAGDIIHRYLPHIDRVPVTRKARHDFVTEVDRACEQAIIQEIRRLYPDHAILAEESGEDGENYFRWIIDPLDGTSNFLRGLPHFCISIALEVRGRIEHGVVYDPVREDLFTASYGQGARLNDRKIRVSDRTQLEGALIATALPFRQRKYLTAYKRMLLDVFAEVEDIRRAGSAALDLAYTACGRVDAYFELGLKPWDVAAGSLLVREAGGVVSDLSGGENPLQSGHVLAAPFKLVAPMNSAIQPHLTTALQTARKAEQG